MGFSGGDVYISLYVCKKIHQTIYFTAVHFSVYKLSF